MQHFSTQKITDFYWEIKKNRKTKENSTFFAEPHTPKKKLPFPKPQIYLIHFMLIKLHPYLKTCWCRLRRRPAKKDILVKADVGVGPGLGCLRIHGPMECLLCGTVHTVLCWLCAACTQAAHHLPAGPRYTSVWDPAHIPPHHITVLPSLSSSFTSSHTCEWVISPIK